MKAEGMASRHALQVLYHCMYVGLGPRGGGWGWGLEVGGWAQCHRIRCWRLLLCLRGSAYEATSLACYVYERDERSSLSVFGFWS